MKKGSEEVWMAPEAGSIASKTLSGLAGANLPLSVRKAMPTFGVDVNLSVRWGALSEIDFCKCVTHRPGASVSNNSCSSGVLLGPSMMTMTSASRWASPRPKPILRLPTVVLASCWGTSSSGRNAGGLPELPAMNKSFNHSMFQDASLIWPMIVTINASDIAADRRDAQPIYLRCRYHYEPGWRGFLTRSSAACLSAAVQ